MAGEIIRPKDLTPRPAPVASELMVVDNSVNVGAATIKAIVEAGRPAASQAEAIAGTDAAKAMTPLTTKQSIAAEVGTSLASKAQGDKADSAVQPGDLAAVATSGEYDDLDGKPIIPPGLVDGDKGDISVSGSGTVWEINKRFDTVASLLADTTMGYAGSGAAVTVGAGDISEAQGFRYEVAASGASDHHVTTAGGVKLYVKKSLLGFDVDAFGADPTGISSSSAAVQRAQNAAHAAEASGTYPGSAVGVNAAPWVVFTAGGKYLFDTPIEVAGHRCVQFFCPGRALVFGAGTKANKFVVAGSASSGGAVRYALSDGIHYQNFDEVFSINSSNLDLSMWSFRNGNVEAVNRFLNTHTYALSRSVHVTIENIVFQTSVVQIARAFVDKLTLDNCWLGSSNLTGDLIYANSLVTINNSMFVPAGTSSIGRSVVRLTNDNGGGGVANDISRGVVIDGCRGSNEGGQGPLVVNDFPVVNEVANQGPYISIINSSLVGFTPTPYEVGNSESGIVYLKQWPAFVSFSGNAMNNFGAATGAIVAKSDSLISEAPDGFGIEMDDATYRSAQRTVGVTNTARLATSLRGFIRNPDPYTFRGLLEDGHLNVQPTATAGVKKATLQVRNGYLDIDLASPIVFLLFLGGQNTTTNGNTNYAGSSCYLVSVSGIFDASAKVEVTHTKLHGPGYGNARSANVDIVSIHFGTGDTGAATAARTNDGVYDLTVVFGSGVALGRARIQPGFEKTQRYGQYLSG